MKKSPLLVNRMDRARSRLRCTARCGATRGLRGLRGLRFLRVLRFLRGLPIALHRVGRALAVAMTVPWPCPGLGLRQPCRHGRTYCTFVTLPTAVPAPRRPALRRSAPGVFVLPSWAASPPLYPSVFRNEVVVFCHEPRTTPTYTVRKKIVNLRQSTGKLLVSDLQS